MRSRPTGREPTGPELTGPELTGPVLLAEDNGRPLAAVDLESGEIAGDSGRPTPGLIALLQLHRLEARLIGALVGG